MLFDNLPLCITNGYSSKYSDNLAPFLDIEIDNMYDDPKEIQENNLPHGYFKKAITGPNSPFPEDFFFFKSSKFYNKFY
jgi:hypothetical protein